MGKQANCSTFGQRRNLPVTYDDTLDSLHYCSRAQPRIEEETAEKEEKILLERKITMIKNFKLTKLLTNMRARIVKNK